MPDLSVPCRGGFKKLRQIGQARAVEALGTGTECIIAVRANLGDDRGDRGADVVARARWSRQRGAHVGGTAEIDSSQHGERLIVLGTPRTTVRIGTRDKLRPMTTSSDLALLSSLGAQLDEIGRRVTEMAERYGETPDSAVATDLFGAERSLFAARRSLDRARTMLEDMS